MKNLIIPCCGRNKLCGLPIWMNLYPDGKYLIEKCIDEMQNNEFDRIIVAVLAEDLRLFDGKKIIDRIRKNSKVEIYELNDYTIDQAQTIYYTIKNCDVHGEIVVRDSDVNFYVPVLNHRNFILGANLMKLNQPIIDLKNKSFCVVNEQNIVLDIIDKQIKSENICIGLFGVKNSMDFVEAYEKLRDNDYPVKGLYVSSIIAYLIGMGRGIFHYFEENAFEPWDNENMWLQIRKEQGCYFISGDKDIDSEFLVSIKAKHSVGAKIIIFFSDKRDNCNDKVKILEENGIMLQQMIFGCGYGEKVIL